MAQRNSVTLTAFFYIFRYLKMYGRSLHKTVEQIRKQFVPNLQRQSQKYLHPLKMKLLKIMFSESLCHQTEFLNGYVLRWKHFSFKTIPYVVKLPL